MNTLNKITHLASWSVADIRSAPQLYRAYLREIAIEEAEEQLDVPSLPWPKEWETYSE